MNTGKRISVMFLALIMILSAVPIIALAATKDEIPTKVRFFNGWDEGAIEIKLADSTQTIDNIKTSSKDLFAMLTGSESTSIDGTVPKDVELENSYTIGLRSEKDDTYTVSFDILDKNKKKVSTKKITVYAYPAPIKSITFDGKENNSSELTGKSAKVKVTLTSGNKIKKLEYGVNEIKEQYDNQRTEMVYKTFKNGGKVTFGTLAYYYAQEYTNSYDESLCTTKSFNTGMTCPTYIRITYYDKYTKQNETYQDYYYKVVE